MSHVNHAVRRNWLVLDTSALLALFVALAVIAGLMPHPAHAAPHSRKNTAHDQAAAHELSIRYDKDRIDARIRDTSIAEVCRDLAQKTGMRCVLDPSVAPLTISAAATRLPLRDAIKRLLAGFSYAIYPADANGKLILKVLAIGEETGNPRTRDPSAASDGAPLPSVPIAAMRESLTQDWHTEMESYPELQSQREWDPRETSR